MYHLTHSSMMYRPGTRRCGRPSAARDYVTEALEIYKVLRGSDYHAPRATMLLAKIEFLAGNAARAVQLSTTALDLTKPRFSISFYFAETLRNLSAYLIACDQWAQAHERARKALDLAEETQYDSCRAWAIQHLAAIAALSLPGDHRPRFEKSARAARLLGYFDALIEALGVSRQYTERQEYDRVLIVLGRAFVSDELSRFMAAGAVITSEQANELARSLY